MEDPGVGKKVQKLAVALFFVAFLVALYVAANGGGGR